MDKTKFAGVVQLKKRSDWFYFLAGITCISCILVFMTILALTFPNVDHRSGYIGLLGIFSGLVVLVKLNEIMDSKEPQA